MNLEPSGRTWTLILSAVLTLSACDNKSGGEKSIAVSMRRTHDGMIISCRSGTFRVGGGSEADTRRIMNACVLACRDHGFTELGSRLDIDKNAASLKPDEGAGKTPSACLK